MSAPILSIHTHDQSTELTTTWMVLRRVMAQLDDDAVAIGARTFEAVARPADVGRPVTLTRVIPMELRRERIVGLLAVALLVAACGGGGGNDGGATSDPGGGPASVDPGAIASEAAIPSMPEVSLPVLDSGDPATADVCGLVTVQEMEQLWGVSGVTQGFFAGPPDTCDYQLDSAPFVAIVLNATGSSFVFDAIAADPATTVVDGIGDRALYNSQQLVFLVQKGDDLISISAFDASKADEERAALLEEIARIAAARM